MNTALSRELRILKPMSIFSNQMIPRLDATERPFVSDVLSDVGVVDPAWMLEQGFVSMMITQNMGVDKLIPNVSKEALDIWAARAYHDKSRFISLRANLMLLNNAAYVLRYGTRMVRVFVWCFP